MNYTVNIWGSKPNTNDDCWNGKDFDNLDAALECFNGIVEGQFHSSDAVSTQWVEIDGPDIHRERRNPDYQHTADNDDDWLREIQHEHLMLHGLQGLGDLL